MSTTIKTDSKYDKTNAIINENEEIKQTKNQKLVEAILMQLEQLKLQQMQTASTLQNLTSKSTLDTSDIEQLKKNYTKLKFGLDPYMQLSKINPTLGMFANIAYSNFLLRPAKYGFLDKVPAVTSLSNLMGIPLDMLQAGILTHYFTMKSPDILKNIYEREKSARIIGRGGIKEAAIEHAYQAGRLFSDVLKLTYMPTILAYSAGLGLKFAPYLLSGLGSALSTLPFGSLAGLPLSLAGTAISPFTNLTSSIFFGAGNILSSIFNPFNLIFGTLGHVTGAAKLGSMLAPTAAKIPFLGSLLSYGLMNPAIMGLMAYSGFNIAIGLARALSMKKFRTHNINAYEIEQKTAASQQLQPFLMQILATRKNVNPIDILMLQTLFLIEQHTSIIPLLYNLLHNKQEEKHSDIETSYEFGYKQIISPYESKWYEKPQKFLEKVRAKYDPFAIIANYITTGKTPTEFIRDVLYGREKETKIREEYSKILGVSYTTVSLLGTTSSRIVSKAKTYQGKVILLLSAIFDVLKASLAELITIRKGFGFQINRELGELFSMDKNEYSGLIGGFFKNVILKLPSFFKKSTETIIKTYKQRDIITEKTTTTFNAIKNKLSELKTQVTKIDKSQITFKNIVEKILSTRIDDKIDAIKKIYTKFKEDLNVDLIEEERKKIEEFKIQDKELMFLEKIYYVLDKIYTLLYSSFTSGRKPERIITVSESKINEIDKKKQKELKQKSVRITVKPRTIKDYFKEFKQKTLVKLDSFADKIIQTKYGKKLAKESQYFLDTQTYTDAVKSVVREVIQKELKPKFNIFFNTIQTLFGSLPRYEKGGEVKGKDKGKDSILALLRPGEYVLSHEHLKNIGKYFVEKISNKFSSKSITINKQSYVTDLLKEKHEEIEKQREKKYKNTLLSILESINTGINKLVKFFTSIFSFGKKKSDDSFDIFDLFGVVLGGLTIGKRIITKIAGAISKKIISPVFKKILDKILPESIKIAGKSIFEDIVDKLTSFSITNILKSIISKLGSKLIGGATFGISSLIIDLIMGEDLKTSISGAIGAFAGGLLGTSIGPIGTFLGSVLGAELGKLILPNFFDFFDNAYDAIKTKINDIIDSYNKKVEVLFGENATVVDIAKEAFTNLFKVIEKGYEKVIDLLITPFKLVKMIYTKFVKMIDEALDKLEKIPIIGDKIKSLREKISKFLNINNTTKQSKIKSSTTVLKQTNYTFNQNIESDTSTISTNELPQSLTKLELSKSAYTLDQLSYAQMMAESSGNVYAISSKGAKGLYQFMPATWKYIWTHKKFFSKYNPELLKYKGIPDIFDVRAQYNAYKAYIGYLKDKFGDTRWALAAYNWGEGNVMKLYKKTHGIFEKAYKYLPKETQQYISKIEKYISAQTASTDTIIEKTISKTKHYIKDIYNTLFKTSEEKETKVKNEIKQTAETQKQIESQMATNNIIAAIAKDKDIIELFDRKTIKFINDLLDTNILAFEDYIYYNVFDSRA